MNTQIERVLYQLWFLAESTVVPRPMSRVGESFEGWAYRKGLRRELERLEYRAWLERTPAGKGLRAAERICRLTERGRLVVLGGRDPEAYWNRPWDGTWRLLVFDLPQEKASARKYLRSFLKQSQFGMLQKSV